MSVKGAGALAKGMSPGSFGIHEGHRIQPHRHVTAGEAPPVCSERYFCQDCRGKGGAPPGTWFDGPRCPGTVGKDGKR